MILDSKKLSGSSKIISFLGLSTTAILALVGLAANHMAFVVTSYVFFALAALAFITLFIVASRFPENQR
jgi:hypothetical protein